MFKFPHVYPCPVCGNPPVSRPHGALSRVDNKTTICAQCALAEAFDPNAVLVWREELAKNGFVNYGEFLTNQWDKMKTKTITVEMVANSKSK